MIFCVPSDNQFLDQPYVSIDLWERKGCVLCFYVVQLQTTIVVYEPANKIFAPLFFVS